MTTGLTLPLDFERWPEIRLMAHSLGPALTVFRYIRLWVDLAYAAQLGNKLGLISETEFKLYALSVDQNEETLIVGLIAGGVLTIVPGGYECARFAKCNPHLDPDYKPMHIKGAEASRYNRDLRKFAGTAAQESLLIPEGVWTRPDGTKMDHEEVKRVMLLIRSVDGALGRPERPANGTGYSEGLAQDAYRVVKDYLAEQIEGVCRWLLEHRGRAGVPATAEQFLARWEEFARGRK